MKFATELNRNQIIERGISDFNEIYIDKVYENGNIAKLAIYCGNIRTLEEDVYPFLVGTLKINPDEILKFHGGNKEYKLPIENELLFNSLDIPQTKAGTKNPLHFAGSNRQRRLGLQKSDRNYFISKR